MHWAVAAPFVVCWSTALVLMLVYNPDPTRPFRAVFSWTHRLSALGFLGLPLWIYLRHRHDRTMHAANIREAWSWTLADVKWILLKGPAAMGARVSLPEQGKFNAGEKINFMILTATFPLYIATGLAIWFHQYVFVAWIVHLSLAALATPLLLGHVFLATLNPDTRVGLSGMITGFVDRHWAAHHYGRWFRATHGGAADHAEPAALAPKPVPVPGPAPMPAGVIPFPTQRTAGPQSAAVRAARPVPRPLPDPAGVEVPQAGTWPPVRSAFEQEPAGPG